MSREQIRTYVTHMLNESPRMSKEKEFWIEHLEEEPGREFDGMN